MLFVDIIIEMVLKVYDIIGWDHIESNITNQSWCFCFVLFVGVHKAAFGFVRANLEFCICSQLL